MMVIKKGPSTQHQNQTHHAKKRSVRNAPRTTHLRVTS
jgi:hypothetical protein